MRLQRERDEINWIFCELGSTYVKEGHDMPLPHAFFDLGNFETCDLIETLAYA